MKWSTSQVIAALAVLSPILTSWITNRLKLSNARLNFKQARIRREENRLDNLEETFREYVRITYAEINSTKLKFSERHDEIESRLIIYANDELYDSIIELHKFIMRNHSPEWRVKELRKIILIFNKQFKSEQIKKPLVLRKLSKAQKILYQILSKQKGNNTK